MSDDNESYDLTFDSVGPREYIILVTALDEMHSTVHKAVAAGAADEADVEAIHSLLITAHTAPEGLVDATNELAEEIADAEAVPEEDIDNPETIEKMESQIKEATGASAVTAVTAGEMAELIATVTEGAHDEAKDEDDPMFH